jgi:hypothetical protein
VANQFFQVISGRFEILLKTVLIGPVINSGDDLPFSFELGQLEPDIYRNPSAIPGRDFCRKPERPLIALKDIADGVGEIRTTEEGIYRRVGFLADFSGPETGKFFESLVHDKKSVHGYRQEGDTRYGYIESLINCKVPKKTSVSLQPRENKACQGQDEDKSGELERDETAVGFLGELKGLVRGAGQFQKDGNGLASQIGHVVV